METQSTLCITCHQSLLPAYYFCPNCGTKVNAAPLSTSVMMQIGIYAYSIVLPVICFITVTKWPGIKYIKSKDKKAKQVGIAASILLFLSTVVIIWIAYFGTQELIQSEIKSLNATLNMQGF